MEMDVHEMLAMKAPITFEIACKAWGDDPNLCDDSTRKCFFAVWALLCFEWAEAMVEHAQSRKVGADKTANGEVRGASRNGEASSAEGATSTVVLGTQED